MRTALNATAGVEIDARVPGLCDGGSSMGIVPDGYTLGLVRIRTPACLGGTRFFDVLRSSSDRTPVRRNGSRERPEPGDRQRKFRRILSDGLRSDSGSRAEPGRRVVHEIVIVSDAALRHA
jgi:hypothetical protein